MSLSINQLIQQSHALAESKGFWQDTESPSLATQWLAQESYKILHLSKHIEALRKLDYSRPAPINLCFEPLSIKLISKLVLLVSEIGEALEALLYRKPAIDFEEELADIAIRWADLCGKIFPDMEYPILSKHEINSTRSHLHGKKA